ncbi:hypothetical protein [Manganibacter manganicus]|uniref:Uncharacterized protein n=1 Tax=Manganibacter manganicus TaxID=1873176 RepID=A0A1V8RRQ9_9HYPH|nr:hypothetical protein [Pseudaminobacter manganicus]OQM75669.1 hypothetical protein BFN67_16990 [Pseudaminobacter manganicus]
MTRKPKRLSIIAAGAGFLVVATALTFYALGQKDQGGITESSFDPSGEFVADSVLAKYDKTYMPKEVADGLKAKGVW